MLIHTSFNKMCRMKYFLICIFSFLFYCCHKKDSYQFPHYSLDKKAKEWLTNMNLNDSLVFIGPNQNKRIYKIANIENTTNYVAEDRGWLFSNGRIYFSYELLKIFFIRTDSTPPPGFLSSHFNISIAMFLPQNTDYTQVPLLATPRAKVSGTFEGYNLLPESPYNNPYLNFPDIYGDISLFNYSNSLRSYNEVIKLFSGNNATFTNLTTNVSFTVNEIWFDKKFGFVFFKDIYGNTWHRIN
jgi:hypothetical protein